MKRNLTVQKEPGQGQEGHSPPSRRAAAPRLILSGCRSGTRSPPQHPGRLHLQREICRAPAPACPTPHRQPGVGTQGTPAHKNPAPTRLAPPRRRVTIPLSSETGWTSGTGTVSARSPSLGALPGLNRLHASAPREPRPLQLLGSPHLSRAPPPFSAQEEAVTLLRSDRPWGRRREGPDGLPRL